MSDTSNGVNSLDTLFLKYACHPMFSKMLNEIINAKPRNLVRAMSERYLCFGELPSIHSKQIWRYYY